VQIDVRVEAPDGRAAARAVTRAIVAEGVRVRRWREAGLAATLYLPAGGAPCATLLVDGPAHPAAAPLLASRGVLVLVLASGDLDEARERLAAVPGASAEVDTIAAAELVVPPNVGVREEDGENGAIARAAGWDALLSRLGARPRGDGDGEAA
jgi:hypothetical protein